IILVYRVVHLGRVLAPRAADKGERPPLLERCEERRSGNARARRVARPGLLQDRRADFVEVAGGVLGALDLAVRRSAGHGKTGGRDEDEKHEDRERGEHQACAFEHRCPSQEIAANATPSRLRARLWFAFSSTDRPHADARVPDVSFLAWRSAESGRPRSIRW